MMQGQRDLFDSCGAAALVMDGVPPEFIERIRGELRSTLRQVREADRLPWPDLTRATLAELRFKSIAGWLPAEERVSLLASFEAELVRLYDVEDRLSEAELGDEA
jgi:hypothetical protein